MIVLIWFDEQRSANNEFCYAISLQGLGMLLPGLCLAPPLPGKLNLSISTTGGLDGAELGIHTVTL